MDDRKVSNNISRDGFYYNIWGMVKRAWIEGICLPGYTMIWTTYKYDYAAMKEHY